MPRSLIHRLAALSLAAAIAAPASAQVAPPTGPLPVATAAAEGLSADRLARMHERLDRFVTEGQIAGAISLVARHGRIVDVHVTGLRDREQRLPMTRDTIVRIYSMSKIVTSVAALVLVEEGRLRLEDPIALYLPTLATPRVFTDGTAAAPNLVAAARPITIRHLLTHTSGLAYGLTSSTVDDMYRDARLMQARSSDDFVARVATLPLIAHPAIASITASTPTCSASSSRRSPASGSGNSCRLASSARSVWSTPGSACLPPTATGWRGSTAARTTGR